MIYFIVTKLNDDYVNLEEKTVIKMLRSQNIKYDKIFVQINDKGKFGYEHSIDYLIDDSFNNCLDAINYGKTGILMPNSYNGDRILVGNLYRTEKFEEVKKC